MRSLRCEMYQPHARSAKQDLRMFEGDVFHAMLLCGLQRPCRGGRVCSVAVSESTMAEQVGSEFSVQFC